MAALLIHLVEPRLEDVVELVEVPERELARERAELRGVLKCDGDDPGEVLLRNEAHAREAGATQALAALCVISGSSTRHQARSPAVRLIRTSA